MTAIPDSEPGGFHGPYRGIVTNTTDPSGQNRIKAVVPQLFGNTSTEIDWALPCQPPGLQSVPAPGQGVWIMFEGGDINYPVYVGMWQGEPAVAPYDTAGAAAAVSATTTQTLLNYLKLSTVTAAGDLIVGTGNGTVSNLPVGPSGTVLQGGTTPSYNALPGQELSRRDYLAPSNYSLTNTNGAVPAFVDPGGGGGPLAMPDFTVPSSGKIVWTFECVCGSPAASINLYIRPIATHIGYLGQGSFFTQQASPALVVHREWIISGLTSGSTITGLTAAYWVDSGTAIIYGNGSTLGAIVQTVRAA